MTAEREGELGRRFELYHPYAPRDHVDVWRAMAAALNWEFTETTPDAITEISKERLTNLSDKAFGDPCYGVLAHDVLRTLQRAAGGRIHRDSSKGELLYFMPHSVNLYCQFRLGANTGASVHEIKNALLRNYEQENTALPFDINIDLAPRLHNPLPDVGPIVAAVTTGKVEKGRLADYLYLAGHAAHEWKGAPGRALDLLCFAAGVKQEIHPSITALDEPLIDYDELFARLGKDYDLSAGRIKGLREKIQQSFANQLCAQKRWSEVVPGFACEGECRFLPEMINMQVRQLPISALLALADSYPRDRRWSVMPTALRDLAERYKELDQTGLMSAPFTINR